MISQTHRDQLRRNVESVHERVARAAREAGRNPDDVRVIAVTKYVDAAIARALVEAGCSELGESRPQVLWDKYEKMSDLTVSWHMIGHLQRKKVKRTLPIVDWIHSVDSERLLVEIDKRAAEQQISAQVLLEINISGDAAKDGLTAAEARKLVEDAERFPNLKLMGLMGMGGLTSGEPELRAQFASLRRLRDELQSIDPSRNELSQLSMGMSGDFEIAIQEGATLVRIGSLFFEGLDGMP